METNIERKSANITIIGKPNAGKSTLLNRLIGQKIAIVTPKVQTTRSSITGIFTQGNLQLVFIDTPGIFTAHSRLEKAMVRCAWSNVAGSDQVIFLIDGTKDFDDKSIEIVTKLKSQNLSPIFVINKIDKQKANIEAIIAVIGNIVDYPVIFQISALNGKGTKELVSYLEEVSPHHEWLYGEEDITNLPMRFLASEITREQLFLQLQEELPYNLTVESESWENLPDGSAKINQVIIVSKQNYKAMILGNHGTRIKNIGVKSREEITKTLGIKVHLFLFVKVREDWDNNPMSYEYMNLKL
jgi:GTP-binding protein Era